MSSRALYVLDRLKDFDMRKGRVTFKTMVREVEGISVSITRTF